MPRFPFRWTPDSLIDSIFAQRTVLRCGRASGQICREAIVDPAADPRPSRPWQGNILAMAETTEAWWGKPTTRQRAVSRLVKKQRRWKRAALSDCNWGAYVHPTRTHYVAMIPLLSWSTDHGMLPPNNEPQWLPPMPKESLCELICSSMEPRCSWLCLEVANPVPAVGTLSTSRHKSDIIPSRFGMLHFKSLLKL